MLNTRSFYAQWVIDCANKVALALGVKQLALAPMHPRCHYSGYQHEDPFNTFARLYNRALRCLTGKGLQRVIMLKTTKAAPEDNALRRFLPRKEMYDETDFERFGFGLHFSPGTEVFKQVFHRSILRTWDLNSAV